MSDAIRPDYKPRQRRPITWAIQKDYQTVATFTAMDAQGGSHPNAQRQFAAWCVEKGVSKSDYNMVITRM